MTSDHVSMLIRTCNIIWHYGYVKIQQKKFRSTLFDKYEVIFHTTVRKFGDVPLLIPAGDRITSFRDEADDAVTETFPPGSIHPCVPSRNIPPEGFSSPGVSPVRLGGKLLGGTQAWKLFFGGKGPRTDDASSSALGKTVAVQEHWEMYHCSFLHVSFSRRQKPVLHSRLRKIK